MLCYIILCYIIFWVLQAGRLCFASKSQRLTEDGSISLVSLLRWYTGSNGSEHKAASYSFSAATLLTGLLGSGVVGCDAGAGLAVMGYRRIYSQLRELKEEKMVTMIMEKESQSGLLETMPEYYKLLAKEFEGDMELLFELFCEVDESNNLMLEEREVEIMLRKMDTGATPEDLRRYVAEINLALLGMHEDFCFGSVWFAASMPDGLPEEVKKKRINVLGFEVAVAESKIRKVFLGATGFFIIFNSLTLPFALPKLRRFLGAPYVPMKRNAVEVPSTSTFSGLMDRAAAVLDAASLAEVQTLPLSSQTPRPDACAAAAGSCALSGENLELIAMLRALCASSILPAIWASSDGCQQISPTERVDCQKMDESSCTAAGCCWSPVDPNPDNLPWCFFSDKKVQTCKIGADPKTPFSASELQEVAKYFEANLDAEGTGEVMASPDHATGPGGDYYYAWARDGALSMNAYLQSKGSLQEMEAKMDAWISWLERSQNQPDPNNINILVEPKYLIPEGTPYTGGWCRPQNDGPGLRSITAMAYAGLKPSLGSRVWALVKQNLDWVVENYDSETCDLWEEVRSPDFFWNRYTMRKALKQGAAFAKSVGGDEARASKYSETAAALSNQLSSHIDPSGYVFESSNRRKDTAVIEAFNVGDMDDGVFAPLSKEVVSTLSELSQLFCRSYAINQHAASKGLAGVLFGRYEGDNYDGGNPWVLLTASASTLLYRQAAAAAQAPPTGEVKTLLSDLLGREPTPQNLLGAGDALLLLMKKYLTNGMHMNEQIDRSTGRFLCAALHEDADRLRPLLKGSFVWWERLVTLDLAKTLEMGGSGLKRGLCRSLAEDGTMWIVEDELAAMLPPVYQQLKALRRMSLAVSYEDMRGEGSKLSAPNCLQEVGSLPAMQELYIATDHCCLEVALLGALAQLGNLRKLWLHLGSLQYNEAVSGALVARLPCKFLEVLSLWGTARLLRDVLSALGPQGSRSMPQLKELDLSMHREAPGGRITDARHGPGEVPSDAVWAVLERGAPGLEHFCLCGALAWYPPISDAWFSTLLQALRGGHGSALRSLDIRQNRIRADVAERLSDRLHSLRSKDFDLLWDGMGGSGTAQVVLFGQVLPAWAARRGGTSSKAGPLAGLRLVDFGSGDGRLVAAAAKRGMHATGYELNPYLVLWSRLRCFRALRTGPGSGQLRWANVWSADLRDADVVTVYGRPGDSFMEHAAKKLDEELPSNAAVVSHFFDVPGWERRLVQDVDGLKLYDFSLRGDDHRSADGPLSFASLIDWWDQARTVPNSLVSEKGSALVASIKGRSYAATVAGLFGDTAVQRRWDQADAEGTLQALRQAYCRTWREVREYKAERDLRKAETECWKEEFFPVSAMSDPFHPMVRIAVTAIDMALDLLAARSLLDAACGDAAWMVAAVLSRRSVQYTGVDIVQHVTEENQRSFPSHRFIAADCSSNAELPQADVVFSKETLNHMFVEDAVQALKCFRRSSRYLVTNIHRGAPNNLGASKGHHAHYVPYDFSLPPFNLRKLCQLVPINHEDWTEFALFAL
ncbi:unnamed protein product [Symbiodinium microadriaticum]|nr:unnamed protein product [Symbiodinium microadriaticum]